MNSAASVQDASGWMVRDGLEELGQLFRAVLSQQSEPILIAGNERNCIDASSGACKLFGLSMDQLIGQPIDDLIRPGTLHCTTRSDVLPGRHVVVFDDESTTDYAFLCVDRDGLVARWHSGAERIYGYTKEEIVGRPVSSLYSDDQREPEQLPAAAAGSEGWHRKRDGSRFWANVLTKALRDENQRRDGSAWVVRDFSARHRAGEASPHTREGPIAGIVSGEFDRIIDANDTFLGMLGYSREDLAAGKMQWPDISAPEYLAMDERAHEEGLLHGACTPFEKEYIHKDGTSVRVLATNAVLETSPFRWITFVEDITRRERAEKILDQPVAAAEFEEIVGTSAALKRVMGQVQIVAPTDATVLVLGETGTGKELVARAIHKLSGRRKRPFVTLNCAAIPTGLLESELFGYERGAFTGALSQKIGRFEMAHQGTLFLDEVGDIPLELQPKLLRALQEKEFERLGGTRTIPIDVRLVAATNRNLTQMMGDKLFRSDLYYRLKVFPITTPPLRDRPEDIPVLARHFTKKYAAKMDRVIEKIPADAMRALVSFPWPGNVRELENFIERSVILSRGPNLRAPLAELRDSVTTTSGSTLEEVERDYILRVFRESNGVVNTAATRLGVPRTTLNAMMKKLGISRADL